MKRFAILFVACLAVGFMVSESQAQHRGGGHRGGYYGGGHHGHYGGYRGGNRYGGGGFAIAVGNGYGRGFSYNNFRPVYGGGFYRPVPVYGGWGGGFGPGFYGGGCGYRGGGVAIGW